METPQLHRYNALRRAATIGAVGLALTGCSRLEPVTHEDTTRFAIDCPEGYEPQIIDVSDIFGEHISLECINENNDAQRPTGLSMLSDESETNGHTLTVGYEDHINLLDEPVSFDFSTNQAIEDTPAQVRVFGANVTSVEIINNN